MAQALRVSEARAQLLLAELSVQDIVEPQPQPQPHGLPAAKIRVTELADEGELLATAERGQADASARKP